MTIIQVVITAHEEGEWLNHAVNSALANRETVSPQKEVRVEIVIVLDSADVGTTTRALAYGEVVNIATVDFADLSQSRNWAVRNFEGDYFAFLDADDAWCHDWLAKCWLATRHNNPANGPNVFHPEVNFHFGHGLSSGLVFKHVSSTEAEFDPRVLAVQNYWSASSFAAKEIYASFPFQSASANDKTGFEDWTFNIETWNSGVEHLVVDKTVHFIREKRQQSMKRDAQSSSLTYGVKVDLRRVRAGGGVGEHDTNKG